MTDNYVQRVEVEAPQSAKALHTAGTVLDLVALGLVLAAVFWNYYVFIAVGLLFAAGLTLNQLYNNADRGYEFAFNRERLVISKENQLGRRMRKLEILLSDVTEFGVFSDLINEEDFVFCADRQSADVKSLRFVADGKEYRLLFEPDGYLCALLDECLEKDVTVNLTR